MAPSSGHIYPNQALQMINGVFEKLIDSEITNAQALAQLKSVIDQQIAAIKDNNELIRQVLSQFQNGFKKEIKDHITKEITENNEQYQDGLDRVLNLIVEHQTYAEEFSANVQKYQQSVDVYSQEITNLVEAVKDQIGKFHSISFWVKLMTALIVALGSLLAILAKLHSLLP